METHDPGTVADRLEENVRYAHERLTAIDVDAVPHGGSGWTPRELVGHLIDSASNNHGRFVRAQLAEELVFPGYDQDAWVASQAYAGAPWGELLDLWRSLNLHLARVMRAASAEACARVRREHNFDAIAWRTVARSEPTTLAYFMADYVDHMEHHLEQLFALLGARAER